MRRILKLPSYVQIEYKPHRDALTDGSSFRNTTVWKSTANQKGTWTADGASAGNPAGTSPRADGVSGTGNSRSFNGPTDGTGGNKFRQHTALPPGGDQAAWGQNRERPSWKPAPTYSVSTSNNDSILSSGNPPISPIVSALGGDSSSTAPPSFWGAKRDNNENGDRPSGGWNRDRSAGTSERERSGDRERGNFYRDEEATTEGSSGFRSQPRNFRDSTTRMTDANPTGTGNTYQRRRFDAAAAPSTVAEAEKKSRAPVSNVSDQISVWGRGVKQVVVAEPPADTSS